MKYHFLFCLCGRIHIVPDKLLSWAMDGRDERSIIQTCTNCGRTSRLFFQSHDSGVSLTLEDIFDEFSGTFRFQAHSGIPVPMMTGKEADTYYNGFFLNDTDWEEHETESMLKAFQAREDWITVDTEKLAKMLEQQFEDARCILEILGSYNNNIVFKNSSN